MSKSISCFFEVKKFTPYTHLLLETISPLIDIVAMERFVEYMLKDKKNPSHRHHKIASKKIQSYIKTKYCVSVGFNIIGKMLWKMGVTYLLHDASIGSYGNDAFWQCQCIVT